MERSGNSERILLVPETEKQTFLINFGDDLDLTLLL
jgi:hypothetical protein